MSQLMQAIYQSNKKQLLKEIESAITHLSSSTIYACFKKSLDAEAASPFNALMTHIIKLELREPFDKPIAEYGATKACSLLTSQEMDGLIAQARQRLKAKEAQSLVENFIDKGKIHLLDSALKGHFKNMSFANALKHAVISNQPAIVDHLLKSYYHPYLEKAIENDTGKTILHLAAERGHQEICRLILRGGIEKRTTQTFVNQRCFAESRISSSIEAVSKEVHDAYVSSGYVGAVALRGQAPRPFSFPAYTFSYAGGQSAYELAEQNGHREICRLLRDFGASRQRSSTVSYETAFSSPNDSEPSFECSAYQPTLTSPLTFSSLSTISDAASEEESTSPHEDTWADVMRAFDRCQQTLDEMGNHLRIDQALERAREGYEAILPSKGSLTTPMMKLGSNSPADHSLASASSVDLSASF